MICNRIFQFIWLMVFRPRLPVKVGDGLTLACYETRILGQLRLAVWFGRNLGWWARALLYGDSNAEFTEKWKLMTLFPFLALDIGKAGMRADQWSAWFLTPAGAEAYALIKELESHGCVVFQNVGGNNVLQRQMGVVAQALTDLQRLFPKQWAFNLPPIAEGMLAVIGFGLSIHDDVALVNGYIASTSAPRVIDVHSQFMDQRTGEGWIAPVYDGHHVTLESVLRPDGVHFTDGARRVIVEEIVAAALVQ